MSELTKFTLERAIKCLQRVIVIKRKKKCLQRVPYSIFLEKKRKMQSNQCLCQVRHTAKYKTGIGSFDDVIYASRFFNNRFILFL